MTTTQILIYALGASLAITGLFIVILIARPWRLFSKHTVTGQRNRYYVRTAYNFVLLTIYKVLRKFKLTSIFMTNLASMYEHMYVMEKDESRVKATSLVLKEIVIGILTVLFGLKYFENTFLVVILTYMMVAWSFQKFKGDGQRFLEELEDCIGDMIHMYNAEGQNIDRMFARILDDEESYMYRYMDQMYTYLKRALLEPSNQMIIAEYNKTVASRHLRLIFNYLYITHRYGDEVNINGEVLFNRNMLAVQREVHADFMKMKQIKDATVGEIGFIIGAVLMIPAAGWYMGTFFTFDGFELINRFLNSSLGDIVEIFCGVFSLICFYIYMKFLGSNTALEYYKEMSWEESIINKSPKLKRFLDSLAPKRGTRARRKLEEQISMTEGYVGVRPLYLRKLVLSLVVTAISITLLSADTYTTYSNVMGDIYSGVNKEQMDIVISLAGEVDPQAYKQMSLTNDQLVIDYLKEHSEEYYSLTTLDGREEYIRTAIKTLGLDYGGYPEIAAQRIQEKFIMVNSIDIKAILVIVFGAMLLGYMVPNLAIKLKLMLNSGAIIYDEVIGCYTVVILLINHSSSNIYMLIQWLTSFANIFRGKMQQCLDNLCESEIKALADDVEDKSFKRLVECMCLAYRGTDLKSAFAGIEQRHLFQEESRRVVNEQVIRRRIAWSSALSWAAMGVTFVLYIFSPMIMAIIEMLTQLL